MGQNICGSCVNSATEPGEIQFEKKENSLNLDLGRISKDLDSVVSRFMEMYDEDSDFEVIVKNPTCEVQSKELSDGHIVKIQFPIPFEPEDFLNFLAMSDKRTTWDSNVLSCNALFTDSSLRVVKTVYKGFLLISPRESLLASKRTTARGNLLDVNMSVLTEYVPVGKDNVRVDVKLGGYYFQPLKNDGDGNLYMVTGLSQVDFGFTPALAKAARKISATAMPKFTKNLIAAVKQHLSSN